MNRMGNNLIFLVGYMGAGKTTVGKKLAAIRGYSFIDLDQQIEKKTGLSVSAIFKDHGEEYFRLKEQEALYALKENENMVVATGGGCAAYSDNMEWMKKYGATIYLQCKPGILFHRLAPEKNKRPLLAQLEDVDIMEFILESLKKRLPSYVKAEFIINGDDDPDVLAKKINDLLKTKSTSSSQD